MNIKKGSLVQRELTPKAAEGLFYDDILFLQSLRHAYASHLPLHKGGSLSPDSTPKRCNSPILQYVCKRTENVKFSVLFAVGANCVRPRSFTERPYEDDFLSVGKTCFMEDTPWTPFFIKSNKEQTPTVKQRFC